MNDIKKMGGFEFQKTGIYSDTINYISGIYKISKSFPDIEKYGLSDQIRRAATSIALNIAEGWGRYHKKEKAQLYKVARASLFECVAALDIALSQKYIAEDKYRKTITDSEIISKKISALINSIKNV